MLRPQQESCVAPPEADHRARALDEALTLDNEPSNTCAVDVDDEPQREPVSAREAFPNRRNLQEGEATATRRLAAIWDDSSFVASRAKRSRAETARWRARHVAWKRSAAFRRETVLRESWCRADALSRQTAHIAREQEIWQRLENEDRAAVRIQRAWRRRKRQQRESKEMDTVVRVQVAARLAQRQVAYDARRATPPRVRRWSPRKLRVQDKSLVKAATKPSASSGTTAHPGRATHTHDVLAPEQRPRPDSVVRFSPRKDSTADLRRSTLASAVSPDHVEGLHKETWQSSSLAGIHAVASQISSTLESLFA